MSPQARIKRPNNAFIVYSQQERANLTGVYKNNTEKCQELGKRWKALSDEEKAPYYEKARMLREQHERDHPGYKYQPRQKKKRPAPYVLPPKTVSEKKPKTVENEEKLKNEDVAEPWTADGNNGKDGKDPEEQFVGAAAAAEGVATTSQDIAAYFMPYHQTFNYYNNYQYYQQLHDAFYLDTSTSNGSSPFSFSSSSSEVGDDVALGINFRIDDEPHEYRFENL